MGIWIPGFERVWSDKSSGGTYDAGYVPKKIWHKTQGFSRFPRAVAKNHANPPHLWVTTPSHPYAPEVRLQIIPLDRSAMALKRPKGSPTSPNKQGAVQTEIEGMSEDGMTDEDAYWLGYHVLGPVCALVPIDHTIIWECKPAGAVPYMATTGSSLRRPQSVYVRFNGQGAHQHVWGNEHWDIGAANLYVVRDGCTDFLGAGPSPVPPPSPAPPTTGDLTVDQADRIIDFLHRQTMALSGDQYTPEGDKIPDVTSIKDAVETLKVKNLELAVWSLQQIAAMDDVDVAKLSQDELADLIVQVAQKAEAKG